jgi:hypothetical protein
MNEPIISADRIRKEAKLAFTKRIQPSACPYPDGSAARELWLREYAELHVGYYSVKPAIA